ncbi:unnamed protein product (macronuclear) [Paramecium tetraurelia]|uniref:Uncharacterized protein n=1 Tax=Paramecium tetraurelia TaxID=5888 RepID=A0C815_PARTE|nr:uncharacterized protein GSPATT00036063001 [Paramecium tetraurelia]CAK66932.1 unnamed protein product [Paramecium tetraurelia]|eukprot:XP_001434329.1 hypothetical protein (macronuclear) [Paramecium tetraurelia strain d4-2]
MIIYNLSQTTYLYLISIRMNKVLVSSNKTSQDLIETIQQFKNHLYYKQISQNRSQQHLDILEGEYSFANYNQILFLQYIVVNQQRKKSQNQQIFDNSKVQLQAIRLDSHIVSGDRGDNQYDTRVFKSQTNIKQAGEEQYVYI